MSNTSTITLVFCENFYFQVFPELLPARFEILTIAFNVTSEQITLYIFSRTDSVEDAVSGVNDAHSEAIYTLHGIAVVTTTDRNETMGHLRQNSVFISILPLAILHVEQLTHDAVIPISHYTTSIQTVFTEEEVVSNLVFVSVLSDIELGDNVNILIEGDQ